MDVLRAAGVTDPGAALRPLLSAALDNALRDGDSALTGPVARGDADAVASHLAALDEYAPAERTTYLALARASAARRPVPGPAEMIAVLASGRGTAAVPATTSATPTTPTAPAIRAVPAADAPVVDVRPVIDGLAGGPDARRSPRRQAPR
jgi:hypothetical protein